MSETGQGRVTDERSSLRRRAQRTARLAVGALLVVLAVAAAVIAGALLAGSIASSLTPVGARIAVAALAAFATTMGVSAMTSAILGLRARDGRLRAFRTLNLVAGTVSLSAMVIAAAFLLALASEPS